MLNMFPLCTATSLETPLKYGTTQSWREEPVLEWNGSYGTLNKYDNEADRRKGYLCYVARTGGRFKLNNSAVVGREQEWEVVWSSRGMEMRCVIPVCASMLQCVHVMWGVWNDKWKKWFPLCFGGNPLHHICLISDSVWLLTQKS